MGIIFMHFGGAETSVVATGGFIKTWLYFQKNLNMLLFMANMLDARIFFVQVTEDEWEAFREDDEGFLRGIVAGFDEQLLGKEGLA